MLPAEGFSEETNWRTINRAKLRRKACVWDAGGAREGGRHVAVGVRVMLTVAGSRRQERGREAVLPAVSAHKALVT